MKDILLKSLGITLLLLIGWELQAQPNQRQKIIDSLKKRVAIEKSDTLQNQLWLKVAQQMYMYSADSLRFYAEKALKVAQRHNYVVGEGKALSYIGLAYYSKRELDKSIDYQQKALKLLLKTNDEKAKATTLNNLGMVYYSRTNYEKSLDYYLQSMRIEEKINNKQGLAGSYGNVGMVLGKLNQHQKALSYYEKAYKIAREVGHVQYIMQIGHSLSLKYMELKKLDLAQAYADSALMVAQKLKMPFGVAMTKGQKGAVLLKQKKFEEAKENLDDAYAIFEKMGDKMNQMAVLINMANVWQNLKKYDQMETTSNKALNLAKQLKIKEQISQAYLNLYRSQKGQKRFEKALESFEMHKTYNDSVFNDNTTKQLAEMSTKYEAEKKDRENKQLTQINRIQALEIQQKNFAFIAIGIVVVLLIFGGIMFYRQIRLKSEQTLLKIEQKLLRAQMNPHFIFNALTAIQNVIMENKPSKAAGFLARFSQLMRQILENSRADFVDLAQEIETLENYLSLQKIRFDNKFDYEIVVDESLDPDEISIPPMFAQPFIENSLEHGLFHKEEKGKIEIRFYPIDDLVAFEVLDNGIGREKSKLLQQEKKEKRHKSLATQITRERIALFNRSLKKRIQLTIDDIRDQSGLIQGTKVKFLMPFKQNF